MVKRNILKPESDDYIKNFYVIHQNIVRFPEGAEFKVSMLKRIIKEAEKHKNIKNQYMLGILIKIPEELKKK